MGTTPGAGSGRAAQRGSPRERPRDVEELLRDARAAIGRDEGYQSRLAAATLIGFGRRATDVVGGRQGWIVANLPRAPAGGD